MGGTNLRYLLMANNSLTGDIPDSWSSLVANAQEVDLSVNQLWGSIGISWANNTRNSSNTWSLRAFQLRQVVWLMVWEAAYMLALCWPNVHGTLNHRISRQGKNCVVRCVNAVTTHVCVAHRPAGCCLS